MKNQAKTPYNPDQSYDQIREWYTRGGGRTTVIRGAETARKAARAFEAALEIEPHQLDEPVTF
jgi:hypothetical protein